MGEFIFRTIKFVIIIILSIFYRVKLVGRENIPEDEGVLLCANHIGLIDMFFISYRIKRKVHYMAKATLFENKILAFLLNFVGAFPVRRGTGDIQAVKTVYRYIKEGKVVGIFPEGTRVKQSERLAAKSGAALFAVKTGAYVLPVRVQANYRLFSEVKIIYGKPYRIEVEQDTKISKEELANISKDILDNIYSLGT